MYRFVSVLMDNAYWKLAPMKPCSLILENDTFDGRNYTPASFHEYSKQYFDDHSSFFRSDDTHDFSVLRRVDAGPYPQAPLQGFPTPYSTGWTCNDTACFHHFSGDKQSDTILLFAPGWGRSNLNAEADVCMNLQKLGIDTCLLVKPFHQQRTPPGFASGELFISGNIFLTAMNFRQFVSEIIFLIDYFKTKYKRVGLIGMSSGGFQCGLAADAVEVDFYFPIITGATLGSITWEGIMTKSVRRDILKKCMTDDELNKAWAISDQVYLAHHCKAKRIKQFISLYDEVIPTKYQMRLWEMYGKPAKTFLHCAHAGIFLHLKKITAEIAAFVHANQH